MEEEDKEEIEEEGKEEEGIQEPGVGKEENKEVLVEQKMRRINSNLQKNELERQEIGILCKDSI